MDIGLVVALQPSRLTKAIGGTVAAVKVLAPRYRLANEITMT